MIPLIALPSGAHKGIPLIDTLINFFLAKWDFGVDSLKDFA